VHHHPVARARAAACTTIRSRVFDAASALVVLGCASSAGQPRRASDRRGHVRYSIEIKDKILDKNLAYMLIVLDMSQAVRRRAGAIASQIIARAHWRAICHRFPASS